MKNSSDLLQPTTPPRTPPTAGRRRRRTYIKKYHETHEIPALNRGSLPSQFFVAGKLVKAGLRWITQRYTAQLRPDERSFIHAERSVAPRRRRNNSKGNKENENSREKKWYCYLCDPTGLPIDRQIKHEVTNMHRDSVVEALEISEDDLPKLQYFFCKYPRCAKFFRRTDQLTKHEISHQPKKPEEGKDGELSTSWGASKARTGPDSESEPQKTRSSRARRGKGSSPLTPVGTAEQQDRDTQHDGSHILEDIKLEADDSALNIPPVDELDLMPSQSATAAATTPSSTGSIAVSESCSPTLRVSGTGYVESEYHFPAQGWTGVVVFESRLTAQSVTSVAGSEPPSTPSSSCSSSPSSSRSSSPSSSRSSSPSCSRCSSPSGTRVAKSASGSSITRFPQSSHSRWGLYQDSQDYFDLDFQDYLNDIDSSFVRPISGSDDELFNEFMVYPHSDP